jgi:hypothetical protein
MSDSDLARRILLDVEPNLDGRYPREEFETTINKYAHFGETIAFAVAEWMLIFETVVEDIEELYWFSDEYRARSKNNDLTQTVSWKCLGDIIEAQIELYSKPETEKEAFIKQTTETLFAIYLPGISIIVGGEVNIGE